MGAVWRNGQLEGTKMKITTRVGEIVRGWSVNHAGEIFSLADVYSLLPDPNDPKKQASCRCKLERFRDREGLTFLGKGTYVWPVTQETQTMLARTPQSAPETAMSAAFAKAEKRRQTFAALDELLPAKKGVKRKSVDMSREEWLDNDKYPYWPYERDYLAHAEKLLSEPTFDPNHPVLGMLCALVTVKETGLTYKINSMTTSCLAKAGKVNFPATVHVVHYYVDTLAEGQVIYKGYDAPFTGKGAKDKLVSALKVAGVTCKSNTFVSGQGTTGINIALRAMYGQVSNSGFEDVDDVVKQLRYSIRAADKIVDYAEQNRGVGVMKSSPVIAAMILTFRKIMRDAGRDNDAKIGAKVEWEDFWTSVVDAKGHGDDADPHVRIWTIVKDGLKGSGGSRKVTFNTLERALYCWNKRGTKIGGKIIAVPLAAFLPIL